MATDMAYMMQMGNIPPILDRIQEAGTPPKFTHEFLKNSLGFRGSGDRGVVKVLKQLGFLSADSVPTSRYNDFRSKTSAGRALAAGLREGWSDIFLADQKAYEKTASELAQIFKGVTGAGDASAKKMAQTFKAFAGQADWTELAPEPGTAIEGNDDGVVAEEAAGEAMGTIPLPAHGGLPISLHHDIHVHLPATSDVSVYGDLPGAARRAP